jgi:5-oxoprolinase (ATP-hydrolysing) subunit A
MNKLPIDINCDMGESLGENIVGQDEKLIPFITSCNIACGFHGGDPVHIQKTIKLALAHNVRIGAHPSYPDLEGFGRRKMEIAPQDLMPVLIYQISALKGMVEAEGGKLRYVKPHGALYNKASVGIREAYVIIDAIKAIDSNLALMGLAGSKMETAAKEMGVSFIAEAFGDRKYVEGGVLMSRDKIGSVFTKVEEVISQVQSILVTKNIETETGKYISVKADSICIHGDNPMALAFLQDIHQLFNSTEE